MNLTHILVFLLVSIGTSQLWNNSKIFNFIRCKIILKIPIIRDALLCSTCSSFWIGIFISLFFNPLSGHVTFIISNIMLGIITYLICGILFKKNILTDD